MKKVLFLLLLISNLYSSGAFFYISYRSVLNNNLLTVEKFHISRVMVLPQGLVPIKTFEISSEKTTDLNVPKFFRNNQDKITQELFKLGIFINDEGNIRATNQNNKSVLTLPPTIVSVSVKDNFVNITLYKGDF